MNLLLPPLAEAGNFPALSDLEERLQGAEREQVLQQTRQQIQEMRLQVVSHMQQGASLEEYRVLEAVRDACLAASELIDSL